MTAPARLAGLLCPVVTPFRPDLSPDPKLLAARCRWLLSQGSGLAVFGTNSEANSMSVDEKIALLEYLVDDGIDPARLMPGTGCCALPDTVRLTAAAVRLGCAGVLVLPPFYYKGVSDNGLYASFAEVIERVGDARLRIYLYHIPPVAGVGIGPALVERLVSSWPGTVVGIKDSSGDWDNTRAMLERGWDDFRVFVGSETFLLANLRSGGAGCISATANVNPAPIARLCAEWQADDAEAQQRRLDAVRAVVQRQLMIPALKAVIAHYADNPEWRRVRPPLEELEHAAAGELVAALEDLGFAMPGLAPAESRR